VKNGAVLGIDTSCYTTSCAVVALEGQVLSSVRIPLAVGRGERGLRQSEAVFQHVKQLPEALQKALTQSERPDIKAVCASAAPTGQANSYMPVFVSGWSFARGIAQALDVPCYATSHQQGHFAAARIGLKGLLGSYLGMHLSGGTTEVLRIAGEGVDVMGGTLDISAGQLIDRVGVALGFSFPAGPSLEKLAMGTKAEGRYPAVVKESVFCSFSGVEDAAMRDIASGMEAPLIAAELFDCVSRVALKMAVNAVDKTGYQSVLITGGVASSSLLKELLRDRIKKRRLSLTVHFGQAQYAADNAAGVAVIGLEEYRKHQED
jgi:N6-L-threonylcarbamoyladenine synthase